MSAVFHDAGKAAGSADPQGPHGPRGPGGSPDAAVAARLYRHLVTLRLLSARMVGLQRAGTIAFHASSIGEEGAIAAAALAARDGDWVFPGAREWGAALVRGLSLETYVHHAFGNGQDPAKGHSAPDHPPARSVRVAPASGVAGAHLPQAVGAAWAAQIKKDDVACVALFGEAANATGDLHNALNFAGVFKPRVVFVCREAEAPKAGTAEDRALAYGIASAVVAGSDPLAVHALVSAALARAAEGKGATLVRVTCAPLAEDVVNAALGKGGDALLDLGPSDPLVVLAGALDRLGDPHAGDARTPAARAAIAGEVRAQIDAAVAAAERAAPPPRTSIFDDVYAKVPPHLAAQQAAAQKELARS